MSDTRLTVAVSNDFFKAFNKLPEKSRGKVATFISKFRDNPTSPGLNYERIEGGKDGFIRSVRVDQEIRCIVRAPERAMPTSCSGSTNTMTPTNGPVGAPVTSTASPVLCRSWMSSLQKKRSQLHRRPQEIQAPSPSHEPKSSSRV